MPGPVSSTSIVTRPALSRERIVMRPGSRPDARIACSALTTKFSSTCWSSVSTADTYCVELSSTRSSICSDARRRCRSSATEVITSVNRMGAAAPGCWRANIARLRMMLQARALLLNQPQIGFHRFRHVGLHLQQLREAENRLERVVDLVGDAGNELADRGETF